MSSASQMYHQAIQTLAQEAVGHGQLEAPSASAFLDNPLCGDCVQMQVLLTDRKIQTLAHHVRGCLLCRAAASLIGKHAIGATLEDIEQVAREVAALLRQDASPPTAWEELALFTPVHGHPSRYGCVELPFRALIAAMKSTRPQA